MNFAKRHNRPYLAANTGHGWPIMTQTQNGILIRIDKLNKVTVRDDGTFTIAAGVRNYQLIAALDAKGREACKLTPMCRIVLCLPFPAHGVCDCAGSMGLTLGGGHARKQGLYGLMADNLISARLILASGKIITVSNGTNPSLFWALRGAGHNFGIVTEATFYSQPQTNGGLNFNSDIIYNASAIEPLFTAINSFKLPPHANIFVFYAVDPASGNPIVIFNLVYSGLEKTGKAMVDHYFGDIPAMSRKDSMIPYGQLNRIGASGFFETACQEGRRRAGHTVGIKSYDPKLQAVLFEKFSKTIKDYPEASGSAVLFESYALEKFQEIDHRSTAYPNRDVNIIVLWAGNYVSPALDDVMNEQGSEFIALMQKSTGYSQSRVYVNYAHGDENPKTYYGYESWRLERLNGLKKQYDPQCRFGGYMPLPYCIGRSH